MFFSRFGKPLPLILMETLRNNLLKKDVPWKGSPKCQCTWQKIKSLLAADLFFPPNNIFLNTSLVFDASDTRIGAGISHMFFFCGSQKAIVNSARSERNYGQIE